MHLARLARADGVSGRRAGRPCRRDRQSRSERHGQDAPRCRSKPPETVPTRPGVGTSRAAVPIPPSQRRAARTIQYVLLGILAFGVLAFGAVYPWAYSILAPWCVGIGVAAWSIARHAGVGRLGLGW